MPSQTTNLLVLGAPSPAFLTARQEQKKERSLLLTRMLLRYLARTDAKLHAAAKARVRECYARRKADDPWLVLDALQSSLRATVGERHWRQAHEDADLALRRATTPEAVRARARRDPPDPPPPPQLPTLPTPSPVPGFAVDPAPAAVARARARSRHLLLLRHASTCTAGDGRCAAPDCAATKALWRHLGNCADSHCKFRHCLASRSLLSHYRRCRGPCAVCGPVKEIIREELKRKAKKSHPAPPSVTPPHSLSPAGASRPLLNAGGHSRKTSVATASPLYLIEEHPSPRANVIRQVAPLEGPSGLVTVTLTKKRGLSRMTGRLPLKKRSARYESWNAPLASPEAAFPPSA